MTSSLAFVLPLQYYARMEDACSCYCLGVSGGVCIGCCPTSSQSSLEQELSLQLFSKSVLVSIDSLMQSLYNSSLLFSKIQFYRYKDSPSSPSLSFPFLSPHFLLLPCSPILSQWYTPSVTITTLTFCYLSISWHCGYRCPIHVFRKCKQAKN